MFRSKIARVYREIPYRLGSTKVPPPQTIYLVVNSVCNLHCKMCDVGMHMKDTQFYKNMNTGEELPYYAIEKLIKDMRKYNPLIAIISTEPLLYKKIIDVIKLIRKNGMSCQLTTNGLLLPEKAEDLVKSDLDVLYVSIDGPKETHNLIRGNEEAWDNAIWGMNLIRTYKDKLKSRRPRVRVNYTISGYNYDKLMDFLKSVYIDEDDEDGIIEITRLFGHVDFSHLNMINELMQTTHNSKHPDIPCTTSSLSDPDILNVDIGRLWQEIQDVKATYSNRFVSFTPDLKSKADLETYYRSPHRFIQPWNKCKVPWTAAQILSNGDVGVSTRCFNVSFGNIKNTKFMQIWNGDKMLEFRLNLKKYGAYPACTRCCGVF